MGWPKSPMWESEGEAWSEDESVSSNASREGNVGCLSWPVSLESFDVRRGVIVERGFSFRKRKGARQDVPSW